MEIFGTQNSFELRKAHQKVKIAFGIILNQPKHQFIVL